MPANRAANSSIGRSRPSAATFSLWKMLTAPGMWPATLSIVSFSPRKRSWRTRVDQGRPERHAFGDRIGVDDAGPRLDGGIVDADHASTTSAVTGWPAATHAG